MELTLQEKEALDDAQVWYNYKDTVKLFRWANGRWVDLDVNGELTLQWTHDKDLKRNFPEIWNRLVDYYC
jgi:hypothetical protein